MNPLPHAPQWDNSFARLPSIFHAPASPALPDINPSLAYLNPSLVDFLGWDVDWINSDLGLQTLAGQSIPRDHQGTPAVAMAYAGHQFGNWVPRLGDGRAMLLGECIVNGERWDIHLKGSGATPFARRGDGRAALGPVLREVLISEAMHALGIPTTRSLAALRTGDRVRRESGWLPGAVLVRLGQSHLRVGSMEYAAQWDRQKMPAPQYATLPRQTQILADYVLARHAPTLIHQDYPYRALLQWVIARQAKLIAQWMHVGFIHGVMNSDNMSLIGDTIDYGPCAFMDGYDPAKAFSSIDTQGRYAYGQQPNMAQWNLSRLAESLLPILTLQHGQPQSTHDEKNAMEQALAWAQEDINAFPAQYEAAWLQGMAHKLGLATDHPSPLPSPSSSLSPSDINELGQEFLTLMAQHRADFTLAWRALTALAAEDQTNLSATAFLACAEKHFAGLIPVTAESSSWLTGWRQARNSATPESLALMQRANPVVIPRNHLVERALSAAEMGDDAPFHALLGELAEPFAERPNNSPYTAKPPENPYYCTFCGT